MAGFYEIVVDGMREGVNYFAFRSHPGQRYKGGKVYTGPVYMGDRGDEISTDICEDCKCNLAPDDNGRFCKDCTL